MSIFIPFSDEKTIGGPSTFMTNLQKYLDDIGFEYSDSPGNSDGIFFPISYDVEVLKQVKSRNGRIIQRLDGIYYPSKHGNEYEVQNGAIKEIYLNYATHIIFQSEYSRAQCFEMFGEKPKSDYSIIINGVDKTIFYPGISKQYSEKLKFITTGNFRNIDMLEPVVLALDELKGIDFELLVVGPVPNNEIKSLLNRKYVKYYGTKGLDEVAELLRSSDIFLYSHLNPPCPNSVIEAISVGLPVVGFDSGAMSELLSFSHDLLAPVSNKVFQKYADFDYQKLLNKIELTISNIKHYQRLAQDNSGLYDFVECGQKYVQVFNQ